MTEQEQAAHVAKRIALLWAYLESVRLLEELTRLDARAGGWANTGSSRT